MERVLDRGVVVDATHVITVADVHLATIDTWLVIASLSTYEELAASEAGEALGLAPLTGKRPEREGPSQ